MSYIGPWLSGYFNVNTAARRAGAKGRKMEPTMEWYNGGSRICKRGGPRSSAGGARIEALKAPRDGRVWGGGVPHSTR